MIREIAAATPEALAAFDEVIDVRSPAEFAEDHLPGAINLPVLSDDERAEVGTIYVQRSKFAARKLGAAYVSANIARHLAGPLADRSGGYAPLIYCWRGGQRSTAMATVLSQVGWRVALLRGGYRTYRREVVSELYEPGAPLAVILLSGPTGSGKTEVLQRMAQEGSQVLDLETLAGHRGSLFGEIQDVEPPSQKLFESRLTAALRGFDSDRSIVVEAESSRIGDLRLPPRLWQAMRSAPAIELIAPFDVRVDRAAREYCKLLDRPSVLLALIDRLPRHLGREDKALWRSLVDARDAPALARALIATHYDPAYRRAWKAQERQLLGQVVIEADSRGAVDRAAKAVAAIAALRPLPLPSSALTKR